MMNIPDNKAVYEYCLLRYVPDIERGEFVNVGLMMMSKRYRWIRVAVDVDPERIKALSPLADIPLLTCQLSAFLRPDVPFADIPVEEKYRWMAAVKSAIIQTSPSHPGILPLPADASRSIASQALDSLFDSLFSRLVTSPDRS